MTVGAGGTTKKDSNAHALHYYAKEKSDGDVELFFLKPDGTHTNFVAETISSGQFSERFGDCSQHDCLFKKKTAEQKKAEKIAVQVTVAQEHLDKKEYNSATFEFGQVLKEDEKNLNAHLGKGKAHMALGETDKAKEHFDAMSENAELFDDQNKHIFNELGIELRKSEMFDDAVRNYEKALEIDSNDEAIYFNMARAYNEWGKKDDAVLNVKKALELKPDFKEATALQKEIES
jgi:tetratricopeptide (TPR) repeat protein